MSNALLHPVTGVVLGACDSMGEIEGDWVWRARPKVRKLTAEEAEKIRSVGLSMSMSGQIKGYDRLR